MSRPLDLDNPPEDAKPYVALYELRMNDINRLVAENNALREKLRVCDIARLTAVTAAGEWEHRYNDLAEKLRALLATYTYERKVP